MDRITIEGEVAKAVSPESKAASMPVEKLLGQVAPRRMDTCGVILPDGVKAILSEGLATIWVHQRPPRVYKLRWITHDSPVKFGQGTRYRTVRLALPYLIVLAVFVPGERGQMTLCSASNECFFRVAPLESLDDQVMYPALLNCSKFEPPEGRPLSWICTQHLNRATFDREADFGKRLRGGFRALMHCLLETGFNYSSENHEASSWFTESRGVDPRVHTVEDWQAASEHDALFVLEVPWLKTGRSVGQVAERIFKNLRVSKPNFSSATALARLIFNHK